MRLPPAKRPPGRAQKHHEIERRARARTRQLERQIRERKLAEARTLQEKHRAETYLEVSETLIVELDVHGVITVINKRGCDLLGREPDELVGKSWFDVALPEEVRGRVRTMFDAAVSGQAPLPVYYDNEIVAASGERRTITWHNHARMEGGKVAGTISSGLDITQRERELHDQTLLRHSMEDAPDAAYWFDRHGTMVYVNKKGCSMLGYTREELLGMPVGLVNPRATEERWAATWKYCVDRGPAVVETVHRRKDGTLFDVELSSCHLRVGDTEYLYGFARDITERKTAAAERDRLQTQLLHAQKMDSIGRLAGGVAHDFNNMLGVILGYAELALRSIAPREPLYEQLAEIRNAAERSADLTRQLLAFARQQPVVPKVLDLNDAVSSVLKMLQRLIGEDIHLTWHPAPRASVVRMDPSQIDQVLANLCVNARDSIADVGQIAIETASCTIPEGYRAGHESIAPGDYVRLRVTDNGCGMSEETISHIFEPFFTTKSFGAGTGLGLSTVYGIARQNGGFVEVKSGAGKGSEFSVFLPSRASLIDKTELAPAALPRGTETLLLVEDDPTVMKMTKRALEVLGYAVLTARTPEDATRAVEETGREIRLALIDVVMPRMNGRDLSALLLAKQPGLLCLFMSGYPAPFIGAEGGLPPGLEFIQKPFSTGDLAAKVRAVIEQRPG